MKRIYEERFVRLVLTALITAAVISGCGRSNENGGGYVEAPPETHESTENPESKPSESTENPNEKPNTAAEEIEPALSPSEENQIVLTAKSLIGIPFRDGGSSPEDGFDNSGLIHYVLRENGYVNCPRGLQEQAVMGNKIGSISELRSGDLVFFSDNGERATFGGIYAGDGIMISCRMPGEAVREVNITAKYYVDSFFTGVRVI
jgi:cell wall-associated NlpC family hydrolase